jgi:nucleoside-diphosphate-sugar epimerase
LLDIAQKVWAGEPVDLAMGYANVIWQGDANAVALRALVSAESPPIVLNLTRPETVSIRALAGEFGRLLGREPILVGAEQRDALLNNAGRAHALFGPPRVRLEQMIEWVADWVRRGGPTLGKPTKFQARDGRF